MKLSLLVAPLAFVAVAACSSSAPENVGGSSSAISSPDIVSRAMEWVNADLHYCQAARGAVDDDSSCWAWEGSSHVCDRQSDAAWNAYRSDCSGFVTWAWGLPPVGDGGYVTSDFAPYDSSFSHTIDGLQLQPGDALNKTPDEHIVLFKQWVVVGSSAIFMEEPGCSVATPYAHEFTSAVSISGPEVYIDYEGATFYAIRYDGAGSGGGSSDACSYGDGYCTATMQCDGGEWVPRQSDPTACTSGPGASAAGGGGGSSSNACSYGDGYCTDTMQCDDGQWVPRQSDPAACTSGPGTTSTAVDACSAGAGFCTATLQCDGGHWIVRSDDSNACTTVDDVSEACSVGDGYCTATLQCDGGHWVPRQSDANACTSGPGG